MQLIAGAFTVLLVSGVSAAAAVLPPTNVNVRCQNLNVAVSWESSDRQPQTSFRVDITGAARKHSVKVTTDHQCDLTDFIWASEERYMDVFYVTVTAVQGGNQSEPVESKTFTFNVVKTADRTCQLDFPPVDLNPSHSGSALSFRNPFDFYSELKQASKSEKATFGFTVKSESGDTRLDCAVHEEKCQRDVVLPEGVQCVTLDGVLYDGLGIGQVSFRQTDRVCVSEGGDVYVIVLITLLSVTILVIAVASFFICKERAHTMKTALPPSLRLSRRGRDQQYAAVSDTNVYAVRVTVHQSTKSCSVSSEEENHHTQSLPDSSASSYVDGALSESGDPEQEEAAGSIAENNPPPMDCGFGDLEEKEEGRSHYDRSHYDRSHVQLDMGDGDMVTGYTGR